MAVAVAVINDISGFQADTYIDFMVSVYDCACDCIDFVYAHVVEK